ncbi:hypothetical protein [Acaryochloris sp. CCMEE 5410]|uniref:hypothetical protein n=1 Tax=Acaryochloris sp. CCMEE 5410 TaxID=310037 RepID=UPI0002484BC8|nr:hypothetical protein [Acaryochloris sp. CCMEE 5410]KAI9130337.1 hypothetical protein ON05_021085 [Acaryochloris sp. CCMEE 5410]
MNHQTAPITRVVIAHTLISALHGLAHLLIPVPISVLQALFIAGVISALQIVAVLLVWRQQVKWASTVLLVSMAGSLLFGLYNHFVVISPDHFFQMPPTSLGVLFQVTAVLLTVSEGIGIGVSVWALNPRQPLSP